MRKLGLFIALLIPACGGRVGPPPPSPFWGLTYGAVAGSEIAPTSTLADRTGGHFIAGTTNPFGQEDGVVVAISPTGSVDWAKTFGGLGLDYFWAATGALNGDLVVTGETMPFGAASSDLWVMRLQPDGAIVWQKTFGGSGGETGRAVWPTSDGGFVIGAISLSFGSAEPWIMKLNSSGVPVWQNRYPSGELWSLNQTPDGGFIATVNPGNED